ncbi:nucleoredoxin 3 [Pelomyxa schiedti]|nr:nucleoredoxin 3 [Pelomyxa schiedti]
MATFGSPKFEALPAALVLRTPARNWLINKTGQRVDVAALFNHPLVGLYFWSPDVHCKEFTAILVSVYNELRAAGNKPFEVVLVVPEKIAPEVFNAAMSEMPWLAVPLDEPDTPDFLMERYQVGAFPTLVLLDQVGNVRDDDATFEVTTYRTPGYPFTKEHITDLAMKVDAQMATLPRTVTDARHAHPLLLQSSGQLPAPYHGGYTCDGCHGTGTSWVYHCETCSFDLHPSCIGH